EAGALLGRLRSSAHASGELAPLGDGLVAAAGAERDRGRAAGLLAEAARIRADKLDDATGAVDALGQALSLRPEDAALVAELTAPVSPPPARRRWGRTPRPCPPRRARRPSPRSASSAPTSSATPAAPPPPSPKRSRPTPM